MDRRAEFHKRHDPQLPRARQPRPAPSAGEGGFEGGIQRLAAVAQSLRGARQWSGHRGNARPVLLHGLSGRSHGGTRRQRLGQRGLRRRGETARAGKATGMAEPGAGQPSESLDHCGAASGNLRGCPWPRVFGDARRTGAPLREVPRGPGATGPRSQLRTQPQSSSRKSGCAGGAGSDLRHLGKRAQDVSARRHPQVADGHHVRE